MINLTLTNNQQHTLWNAILVAAEKYEANARELRAYADQPLGEHAILTKDGAHMVAEQFDHQAVEVRELLETLMQDNEDA